jgi:dipeptidyl aminopeptidase/acylaminoacyl peptidase
MTRSTRVIVRRRVSAAFLLFSVSVARGATKHRVTFDDMEAVKRSVWNLQLSPEGDRLAYVAWPNQDLWLVATKKGSEPKKIGKGSLPRWSPDGKRVAYYSSESGSNQLWVFDVPMGRAEALTRLDGGIDPDPGTEMSDANGALHYAWSPDGARIVFASQVPLPGSRGTTASESARKPIAPRKPWEPLVLTTTTPPAWTLTGIFRSGGFDDPRWVNGRQESNLEGEMKVPPPMTNQLFVVNTRTHAVKALTRDNGVYFQPHWSPDGRRVVCASSEGRKLVGYGIGGTTNIFSIDVATGEKRALTSGPGDKWKPIWSPDGKFVAYAGNEGRFGWADVFVVPAAGGESRKTTVKLERSVWEFSWGPDSQSIIVNYGDGVAIPIARVDVRTGDFRQLTGETTPAFPIAVAHSGAIAWQESSGTSSGLIRFLAPGVSTAEMLVDLNPQIRDWELGAEEVIRWKNGRGEQREGILIRPVGYRQGRKYPLIVDCYPSGSAGFHGDAMSGNQAWASKGYVVFFPHSGGPHVWMNFDKGEKYNLATKGPKGVDVMVDNLMSGVDELIRRGIVDPDRMGLYGFSNGGGVINQLITKTDRFRCAVVVASALSADWSRRFFLHTMEPTVLKIADVTPWEDPQAYMELSAIYRLDKVKTPMLFADGDNDGDFLLNVIEMYNGLRYLGKEVTLLRYPNQEHGFTGEALRDFWQRENAFFDGYLKPSVATE